MAEGLCQALWWGHWSLHGAAQVLPHGAAQQVPAADWAPAPGITPELDPVVSALRNILG